MLKYRSKMALITYGSAAILLFVLGYIFGSYAIISPLDCIDSTSCNRTLTTTSVHHTNNKDIIVPKSDEKFQLDPNLIKVEEEFETTMRSCLGSFCFDDAVHSNDGKDIVRVGILAPDPIEGEYLLKLMTAAGIQSNEKLELVYTSNVPPYGYGKNHGWSRIIRIARSVVPHSLQLLSKHTNGDEEAIEMLIDAQIRQLMRWHCRLSHVAAHTAMLTVYTDELLLHPVTELEKLLTFAGYKANREQLLLAVHTHLPALQQHWSDQYIIQSLYNNNTISGSSTSSINSVHTNTINTILNKAIIAVQKEMKETLNLTKWPCRSFRDLYSEKPREPLHLPLSIGNLIADCKGSYVKCSIRYDIEEYKRTQQH